MRKKRLFLSNGSYTPTALEIQREYTKLTKKLMKKHKTVDRHDFIYIVNTGVTFECTMIAMEELCKKTKSQKR